MWSKRKVIRYLTMNILSFLLFAVAFLGLACAAENGEFRKVAPALLCLGLAFVLAKATEKE